ncbi:MAG: hypothetical protein KAX38_05275, partial [Candidatus Krumholzibacteria bacterium]|nr:hypothetical protein [Candidatus Krumholzibacteria bacterium]
VTGTNNLLGCFFRKKKLEVRIGPPIRITKKTVSKAMKKDYKVLNSMALAEMRMLKGEAET